MKWAGHKLVLAWKVEQRFLCIGWNKKFRLLTKRTLEYYFILHIKWDVFLAMLRRYKQHVSYHGYVFSVCFAFAKIQCPYYCCDNMTLWVVMTCWLHSQTAGKVKILLLSRSSWMWVWGVEKNAVYWVEQSILNPLHYSFLYKIPLLDKLGRNFKAVTGDIT